MSARAGKILTLLVVLLCEIVLLIDLAEDGVLGKAQPVSPPCSKTIYQTCSPCKSGHAESPVLIPPAKLPDILQDWQNQTVLVEIESTLRIIECYLLGSSGGMPLRAIH